MRGSLCVCLLVSALASACGGEKKHAEPAATVTAAPGIVTALPDWPIDLDLLRFAARVEQAAQANDAGALLAGSRWDTPEGAGPAGRSILDMFAVTGGVPRLTAAGCPQFAGEQPSCRDAFVLALSSLPPGEKRDERGLVVLGYRRAAGAAPVLETYTFPQGDDRLAALDGGPASSCAYFDFAKRTPGECVNAVFYATTTGSAPPRPRPGDH